MGEAGATQPLILLRTPAHSSQTELRLRLSLLSSTGLK